MSKEEKRLQEDRDKKQHWRRWGPYMSERQWGSVREDYSGGSNVWNGFPFKEASSRAYRWGEDGIGGISDNHQRICISFAFWNEEDSRLKERLFGLSGPDANHGEDVKEYYYYLDCTPTHSYMKYLYKYPHKAFPYDDLSEENARRGPLDPEYELLDTNIFAESKYFDIFIEYAKLDAEDIFFKLTIENRGKEEKNLHVLPQIFFRNKWDFEEGEKPQLKGDKDHVHASHNELADRYLYFLDNPELLFTENETNKEKLFGEENKSPFVKDGIERFLVNGEKEAVNPGLEGTKAALHYSLTIPAHGSKELYLRFTDKKNGSFTSKKAESLFRKRKEEADDYFSKFQPATLSDEMKNIQRQALSSLLWNKQFYHYVVEQWLDENLDPRAQRRAPHRNKEWIHLYNDDILSVPDKWEYPWFASWDLAFHTLPIALVDPDFAKKQLTLLTREWYMHPNGQIPSYEWDFGDVNPPVHAWATWRVYKMGERWHNQRDTSFLASVFQKLLLNFTWWVNRKDSEGKNVFQGGFLGLDNISVFNRSEDIPSGGTLTQSDATSWMGMYCLNMWTIAMELAKVDSSYEDMASKFFEHFLYIAEAINYTQGDSPPLWDEEDGFYYDVLHLPDGTHKSLKVHSMVGLIPLFAVAVFEEEELDSHPDFKRRFNWFLKNRKDLCEEIASLRKRGENNRHILSILNEEKLKRILCRMLSEEEFLSPHGIRSLSYFHKNNPFHLDCDGEDHSIDYEPAESTSRLFGGNSNWRGPVWFPLNFLIIESLQKYHHYYGDAFQIECPTGSGNLMNLFQVADFISKRLIAIFTKDEKNRRPVYDTVTVMQTDPHWRDYILFYEYFDGNNGKGIGASHQAGWSAIVAKLIQQQ